MTITAVLLAHYKERDKANIEIVVKDLQQGKVRPNKIIVFDDNNVDIEPIRDVTIIKSNTPFPVTARLYASSFADTDYVFLMDSDLSVEWGTLDYLVQQAQKYPEAVLGFDGSYLKKCVYPYTKGIVVNNISDPVECDMIIRLWFLPKKIIDLGLLLFDYGGIPAKYTDDILICLANRYLNGAKNVVLPMPQGRGWREIGEKGVGQSMSSEHYLTRDNTCRYIMEHYGSQEV